MPNLVKGGKIAADDWQYADPEQMPEPADGYVLPVNVWPEHPTAGLVLECDAEIEAQYLTAPMIAIRFPAFSDGRGLSLAVLLRSRHQYTGELRAVGNIHPDIANYLHRCGFDSLLFDSDAHAQAALDQLDVHTGYYQSSIAEPLPAYRRLSR